MQESFIAFPLDSLTAWQKGVSGVESKFEYQIKIGCDKVTVSGRFLLIGGGAASVTGLPPRRRRARRLFRNPATAVSRRGKLPNFQQKDKIFMEKRSCICIRIDHPVLITECVCNPVQSRSKMGELLFETYGVPSVAFGVDAAFSYKDNKLQEFVIKIVLLSVLDFKATHVIQFVGREPMYNGSCRSNIGGFHVTDCLKELLSLKYPYHS
ncbi:hypothetical protein L6164_033004 [Bauhinia variegata]|uniref:Uncharacterized protein n=1 Tax=Bauhinia variegata TaxID=167791 RepID=A0ACB9KQD3_BAUVA|nr:hypothetical protein L6164_033004 [Bauhinia variegata]